MIPAKHFYMIRHGETEANRAMIMAGSLDSPLTETGVEQAKHARDIVAQLEVKPVAMFHSNLSRARDTAHILNEALDVPIFEDADLAEFHAGDFEGVPYHECQAILDGWPIIPNAEIPEDFFARVKRGKMRALSRFEGPTLTVCHGGVMRAFGEIYGVSPAPRFRNAHLYEFYPDPDDAFPWDVYDYSTCEISGSVLRQVSNAYDIDIDIASKTANA